MPGRIRRLSGILSALRLSRAVSGTSETVNMWSKDQLLQMVPGFVAALRPEADSVIKNRSIMW
jgi:hypothetical protein